MEKYTFSAECMPINGGEYYFVVKVYYKNIRVAISDVVINFFLGGERIRTDFYYCPVSNFSKKEIEKQVLKHCYDVIACTG